MADEIIKLFEKHGDSDYIGEEISITNHSLQVAEEAEKHTRDEEVILAGLLHDIGHLVGMERKYATMGGAPSSKSYGIRDHETIGAEYLRSLGMSERVCDIVKNHVNAKRYLLYKEPDYEKEVSEASMKTLGYQGGVMSFKEAIVFEREPNFHWYIQLRKWEEKAKDKNRKTKTLIFYKDMINFYIRKQEDNKCIQVLFFTLVFIYYVICAISSFRDF
jgi:putative nucleotidyltransferase with HDIG domain